MYTVSELRKGIKEALDRVDRGEDVHIKRGESEYVIEKYVHVSERVEDKGDSYVHWRKFEEREDENRLELRGYVNPRRERFLKEQREVEEYRARIGGGR